MPFLTKKISQAFQISLVPALFLTVLAPIAETATEQTTSDLLSLTKQCVPLSGVDKFKTDEASAMATIQMCALKGALWFKADMDIDCDGGSTAECKADRSYQAETSCEASNGKPLDAAKLPFIVLPQDSNGWRASNYNIGCGTIAAVIYKGKVEYGVLGDYGPKGVVGEASYAMAKQLGINSDPNTGGTSAEVTYIIFTGTNTKSDPVENHDKAIKNGKNLATQLVTENATSNHENTVTFQKPTQEQMFRRGQSVIFEGTASTNVTNVKLVVDGKWELASALVAQGKWSSSYQFSGAGKRKIQALGFDASNTQIATSDISILIQDIK